MTFPLWKPVPPDTALRDLFTTSLLILTDQQDTGVLVRCSAGMEEGSAVIVHASTSKPNAWRMTGVDDNARIGSQAQMLMAPGSVRVVTVPHITWSHPERRGRRWRTPAVILSVIVSAISVSLVNPPLTVVVALPVAAAVGIVSWLLLRRHVHTAIAPDGDLRLGVDDVVHHCLSHPVIDDPVGTPPSPAAEAALPEGLPGTDVK